VALPIRLLLDENLSPRLAQDLADLFPGSAHVRDLGLKAADDQAIWQRAAAGGFGIVTKDDDFRQRAFLLGHPPKVIWLSLGNCTTTEVLAVLCDSQGEVARFVADPTLALLVLRTATPSSYA
jgi:predicted nuclease of predicted toxin-antitoxin system